MTHTTVCHPSAAIAASKNPIWMEVIEHLYRERYRRRRSWDVLEVEPVATELEKHCIDYSVLMHDIYADLDGYEYHCELKTEAHPAKRISIEIWSNLECEREGWPLKPIDYRHQDLIVVWIDGTVLFVPFDKYSAWVETNKDTWMANAITGVDDYLLFPLDNGTYTTVVLLIPVEEVRAAFGTSCFTKLEGEMLTRAREAIETTSRANRTGVIGAAA